MAQHQTHVQADFSEEIQIFGDPRAAEKCIKGIIRVHATHNDPVITGFTLQ